jgi:hypothetical protein
MSLAFPSPGHQPTRPEGGGTQPVEIPGAAPTQSALSAAATRKTFFFMDRPPSFRNSTSYFGSSPKCVGDWRPLKMRNAPLAPCQVGMQPRRLGLQDQRLPVLGREDGVHVNVTSDCGTPRLYEFRPPLSGRTCSEPRRGGTHEPKVQPLASRHASPKHDRSVDAMPTCTPRTPLFHTGGGRFAAGESPTRFGEEPIFHTRYERFDRLRPSAAPDAKRVAG